MSDDSREFERDLADAALRCLENRGAMSIHELYVLLTEDPQFSGFGKVEMFEMARRLKEEGKVKLDDMPLAAASFVEYLKLWDRNLQLYTSLAVSFITIAAIYLIPSDFPLVTLRWISASVFVLFIPGYAAVEALFPEKSQMDSLERFALGIGLSLALDALAGLLLNFTPWGIALLPLVITLSILTVGFAGIACVRQYSFGLHPDTRL